MKISLRSAWSIFLYLYFKLKGSPYIYICIHAIQACHRCTQAIHTHTETTHTHTHSYSCGKHQKDRKKLCWRKGTLTPCVILCIFLNTREWHFVSLHVMGSVSDWGVKSVDPFGVKCHYPFVYEVYWPFELESVRANQKPPFRNLKIRNRQRNSRLQFTPGCHDKHGTIRCRTNAQKSQLHDKKPATRQNGESQQPSY